jgi:hypothetical protein
MPFTSSARNDIKLSIAAELVYTFTNETRIIAKLEASRTSDQIIVSEALDIQPPAKILSKTTPYGDRSIRASLSGDVTIRYTAGVENRVRQLLPPSEGGMCGPIFRARCCRFCSQAAFALQTSS